MNAFRRLFGHTSKKQGHRDLFDDLKNSTYLERELQFQHQPVDWQMRANRTEQVILGDLLNKTFDVRKEEVSDMGIVSNSFNQEFNVIPDKDDIWNYDLCKAILNINENGEVEYKFGEHVILIITYRKYEENTNDIDKSVSRFNERIIVHLRGIGAGCGTWFIRATILMPTPAYETGKTYAQNRNQPKSLSVIFAYDETDPQERIAKYNSLREDAFEKIEKGKTEEITVEQSWLLNQLTVNIGHDYWWGRKVLEKKRYWDAIIYFENVYKALREQWFENSINEEGIGYFLDTCYWLGYCYCELQLFEKALFYLDIAMLSDKIHYKEECINCLVNSKDFRAYKTIKREQAKDLKRAIESEKLSEEMIRYHHFLRRREAYVLIDMGKLDEAEEKFKEMSKEEINKDYALSELAYIQELRRQK